MCGVFIPDCGYDNRTINLNGNVYCPNTKCSGKLCMHQKSFQSLGRSEYQSLCVRCGKFLLKIKQIPFFVVWSRGLHFRRDSKINSRCYWRCVLSRQRNSRDGYVTTPRSIYGYGKCGAWLFVDKVHKELVNATKTDKTRFFFDKKGTLSLKN